MSGFFITGTDTGVGKTFVTCALMHALQQRGLTVAPMKPIAAGVSIPAAGNTDLNTPLNEDVALFSQATGNRFPLRLVNPYCFREPIAPHIAAQHERIEVDLSIIRSAYRQLASAAQVVLVEGAGGFLVPLSASESMALIPSALQLPIVLVVGMRLGCLNHALLTVEAIRSRGLTLAAWIANTPNPPGQAMNAYAENLSTLRSLIDAPLLGEIPRVHADSTLQAARIAASHLHSELLIPALEST